MAKVGESRELLAVSLIRITKYVLIAEGLTQKTGLITRLSLSAFPVKVLFEEDGDEDPELGRGAPEGPAGGVCGSGASRWT